MTRRSGKHRPENGHVHGDHHSAVPLLEQWTLSRRDVLKLAGGGATAGALYSLGIRGFHLGTQERAFAATPNDFAVDVLRSRDLLKLNFRFVNLTLDTGVSPPVLRPNHAKGAYVIVRFPMQSVLERAFFETEADAGSGMTLPPDDPDSSTTGSENPELGFGGLHPRVLPSGESGLVFDVPPDVAEIPYDLETLLDWARFRLRVAPHAIPPVDLFCDEPGGLRPAPIQPIQVGPDLIIPGLVLAPCVPRPQAIDDIYPFLVGSGDDIIDGTPPIKDRPHTAIEAPYRVLLSPTDGAAWAHQVKPVEHAGRVELWHTRLGVRRQKRLPDGSPDLDEHGSPQYEADEQDAAGRTARAIYSPPNPVVPSEDFPAPTLVDRLNYAPADPEEPKPPEASMYPFRASLAPRDRHDIVRLTSDFRIENYTEHPKPVQVNRLMLSALGAWIDTRGAWEPPGAPDVTNPRDQLSLEEWRHIATMGRDHYVRIVRKGYLFPFGHRASLVKVTERKFLTYSKGGIDTDADTVPDGIPAQKVAFLRQRMFIVVRQRVKSYDPADAPNQPHDGRQMPFRKVTITTETTPNLNDPSLSDIFPVGPIRDVYGGQAAFWPRVGSDDFRFAMKGEDADGQVTEFTAPLAFISSAGPSDNDILMGAVADWYNGAAAATWWQEDAKDRRNAKTFCQRIAFAPSTPGKRGDTSLEVVSLWFGGSAPDPLGVVLPADQPSFYPIVLQAQVRLREAEIVSGNVVGGGTTVEYADVYLDHGFQPAQNKGEVFLRLPGTAPVKFGGDKGGVATPNMQIVGVSRRLGPIGGAGGGGAGRGSAATGGSAAEKALSSIAGGLFDPKDYLDAAIDEAKLLGGIYLADIISVINDFQVGDRTEKVPTITARAIFPGLELTNAGFESEENEDPWVAGAGMKLARSADQEKFGFQSGKLTVNTGGSEKTFCRYPVSIGAGDVTELTVRAHVYIPATWAGGRVRMRLSDEFEDAEGNLETTADMSAEARDTWQELVFVFRPDGATSGHIIFDTEGMAVGGDFFFVDGLSVSETLVAPEAAEITLFWRPDLQPDEPTDGGLQHVFEPFAGAPPVDAELRLTGTFLQRFEGGEPVFKIVGRLTDFRVNLFGTGGSHFITIEFSKVLFTAGSGKKTDLDVDILDISFHGKLKIINELQEFLKSKGFSIDINARGISVGYTLNIPDVAVGAYALSGMALTAALHIPFSGAAVRFRFAFASRENPFLVTVALASGGGYFSVALGTDGVELLEMSLEFGARAQLDIGVASGSIELMGGLYFKVETVDGDEEVTVTAFLRLEGRLSVLGLIKASVEFYLGLTYESAPDLLIGTARVTVKIEILFFSKTVRLEVRRELPASTHQVTFEELMPQPAWKEYVNAFALT